MLNPHPLRKNNFLSILIFLVLSLFISGCEEGIGQFRVKVVSLNWQPVEAATISGGIDWESFGAKTDSRGIAILPSYAFNYDALIYRNNFFPKIVNLSRQLQGSIFPRIYMIKPTPKQFKFVGNVEGWSIRFDSDMLITVDYHGGYHVYSYNDQGISEIATAQIPAIAIRDTQIHDNTLWFSTHDDGIYVYSLEDPLNPQQIFHLDIPGYLGKFELKDRILVASRFFDRAPLRVYSYNTSGEYQEIAQFGNYYVEDLAFMGNFIVVVGRPTYYINGLLPVVFGIYGMEDPLNPYLIYEGPEPEYSYGFLERNYLILLSSPDNIFEIQEEETVYKVIDLSNPSHPSTVGSFSTDSQLFKIINDSTAMGRFNIWTGAISILDGSLTQGFKTVAVITDNTFSQVPFHQFEGCAPPYFIIGKRIYKLE